MIGRKYMIEIRNLKVSVLENTAQLERLIMKKLRVKQVPEYQILKRSIDARKKPEIYYIYIPLGFWMKRIRSF